MTIEELASISNIKVDTLKKNIGKVKGVNIESEEMYIPDGSRYPYDFHRYRFNNQRSRYHALLMATDKNRYVDHVLLKMPKNSFDRMVSELVDLGYLQDNGCGNQYGANKYDTTLKFSENWIKRIIDQIASSAGHFVGGVISESM